MNKAWNIILVICASGNAIGAAVTWHSGGQPGWFIWTSSILFSVGVAIRAIDDLIDSYA